MSEAGDETVRYRASSIGSCPRYLAYRRLDYDMEPVPAHRQKIFDSGNEQEAVALEWLEEEFGGVVVDNQRETVWGVEFPVCGEAWNVNIVGHIDGIWHVDGGGNEEGKSYLIEVKAMSRARFEKVQAGVVEGPLVALSSFEGYQQQLVCYWQGLGGKEILDGATFLVKLWQQDEYLKIDISPEAMDYFVAAWDEPIHNRLALVEAAVSTGQIPEDEDPGEFGCDQCGARFHCHPERLEEERQKAADFSCDATEDDRVMFAKVIRAGTLKQKAKELKEEAKGYFDTRLDVLETRKLIFPGGGNVQRVATTSAKLDKKGLTKQVGQRVIDSFTTESTTESIRFYPPKEAD